MQEISLPDIVDLVCQKTGNTKRDVSAVAGSVFDAIASELCEHGGIVRIKGFGRFRVSEIQEHEGRDPRTGEAITIPARKRIRFTASKNLVPR